MQGRLDLSAAISPGSISSIGSEAFNCDLWLRRAADAWGRIQVGSTDHTVKAS